ncbi:MAG: arylsulfatase [Candidatus Solibacter usitatus]|nr:arylsulfatase [Candidatus Solibacter usitatus]
MISNRRQFLGTVAAAPLSGQQRRQPNVIILLTDDQGYGDFSCHGNPVLKTPNMDKLHGESVRFTDFHVAPMCTPTRGQLLTGMDALHNRATSVTAGRAMVRRDIPMMPAMFAQAGYATGVFGKWHVGDHYPYRPMDRGFQTAKYHLGFGMSSAPEFYNDYFNGSYHDNGVRKPFTGYCTDFWFSEAIAWMGKQQAANKPFLCYIPTNTPHGPAWVDSKYSAPYQRPGVPAAFFGMIANLDENLGKLEAFLRQSGLRDNTIFVFMTDNGGTAGVNLFNDGMRARKTSVYDGGHRVPCFVRWPNGGLRAPADIDVPAQNQDILPTLLDLCGVPKAPQAKFDGTSLAGLLRGKTDFPDRMMIVQYGQILKKWDSNVIWGKWRLVNGEELYDFRADVGEKNDLAKAQPGVVKKMRDHYEQWWAGIEPTLRDFLPNSIGADAENPVILTSADWEEIYCDNPNAILTGIGGPRGGPWNIDVERDGTYEIALSRWPPELGYALTLAAPEKKLTVGKLPAGKAFPIAAARLKMGTHDLAMKTKSDDKSALFRVTLRKGRTQLHGWFQDAAGTDLCGAYFAVVKRV